VRAFFDRRAGAARRTISSLVTAAAVRAEKKLGTNALATGLSESRP
jgi:hypothetical protein